VEKLMFFRPITWSARDRSTAMLALIFPVLFNIRITTRKSLADRHTTCASTLSGSNPPRTGHQPPWLAMDRSCGMDAASIAAVALG